MNEPRRNEGGRPWVSRLKSGLETPLGIHFVREGSKIWFAPPRWYDRLLAACFVGGAFLVLSALFGWGGTVFFDPVWRLWTGLAVMLAGGWAALSNERMLCNVTDRTYTRWEGKGPVKSVSKGSFNEFDALVLLAESTFGPTGPVVTYRLVLHWKGSKLPFLIVRQATFGLGQGTALNYSAGGLLREGQRVAQAIGVPFFDNSYFHSPEPLRPI